MGLVFMSVAGQSSPTLSQGQKQSLKWITEETLKKQVKDGSWEFFLSRPPINETQLTDITWIVMALQGQTGPEAPSTQREALAKGNAWLSSAKLPETYQSKVLKLLLALRAGKPHIEQQSGIDELLSLQQPDGGWRQLPEMKSDAFATGQTLYVLSLAGYTAERPEVKRAIAFLVATQKPDGSWPMTSRATPDGKPGSAKLLTPITCAPALGRRSDWRGWCRSGRAHRRWRGALRRPQFRADDELRRPDRVTKQRTGGLTPAARRDFRRGSSLRCGQRREIREVGPNTPPPCALR